MVLKEENFPRRTIRRFSNWLNFRQGNPFREDKEGVVGSSLEDLSRSRAPRSEKKRGVIEEYCIRVILDRYREWIAPPSSPLSCQQTRPILRFFFFFYEEWMRCLARWAIVLHFNVTLRGGETLPRCLPIVSLGRRTDGNKNSSAAARNSSKRWTRSVKIAISTRFRFVSFRSTFFSPLSLFFFIANAIFTRCWFTIDAIPKTLKPTYGWPGNFTAHELDSCRHVASARSKLPDPIPSFPEIGTPLEKSIKSSPLPLSFHFSAASKRVSSMVTTVHVDSRATDSRQARSRESLGRREKNRMKFRGYPSTRPVIVLQKLHRPRWYYV